MCKLYAGFFGLGACMAKTNLDTVFRHAAKQDIAMIHLDNKISSDYKGYEGFKGHANGAERKATGKNIANKVVNEIFKRGYKGVIVLGGCADLEKMEFFEGAM